MKYQSLRFFIAVSSFIGWSIIIIGCLFSLISAIIAVKNTDNHLAFFGILIIGGLISVVVGISIFAMGDLYQCFLDIEENTRVAANASQDITSNKRNLAVQTDFPKEEISHSTFTYMCSSCNTFQRSDVITCLKCGAANPHHPSNSSKKDPTIIATTTETVPANNRCIRCGAGMNQADKFCTACGQPRP